MALNLVGREWIGDLALDQNAPALFVRYPSVGNAAPLKVLFAGLLISWIALLEYRQFANVCRRPDSNQFAQEATQEAPILIERGDQSVRNPILGL
jgi:hypothetical protein